MLYKKKVSKLIHLSKTRSKKFNDKKFRVVLIFNKERNIGTLKNKVFNGSYIYEKYSFEFFIIYPLISLKHVVTFFMFDYKYKKA